MIMKAKRILIPTDFSEESISVFKLANTFVDIFGSTIDLIHVVPVTKYFAESFVHIGYPYDLEKELYPKALNVAHTKLEELAAQFIKKEHRGKMISVIDRKPSAAIAHQANSGKYDLLLMSSKGEHSSEFLRGSITEKVIRHCHIPVLSLEQPFHESGLDTVMIPLDLSDVSFEALPYAIEIARQFEAKLVLYHSIELYAADVEMIPLYPPFENEDAIYETVLTKLETYFAKNPDLGLRLDRTTDRREDYIHGGKENLAFSVPIETIISKSFSAHRDIVDYGNENADLIVMSTHGRTGVARLLLGSTTEQVAQHVHVPLLTVRPKEKKSD